MKLVECFYMLRTEFVFDSIKRNYELSSFNGLKVINKKENLKGLGATINKLLPEEKQVKHKNETFYFVYVGIYDNEIKSVISKINFDDNYEFDKVFLVNTGDLLIVTKKELNKNLYMKLLSSFSHIYMQDDKCIEIS